jgi:hypothetical protein
MAERGRGQLDVANVLLTLTPPAPFRARPERSSPWQRASAPGTGARDEGRGAREILVPRPSSLAPLSSGPCTARACEGRCAARWADGQRAAAHAAVIYSSTMLVQRGGRTGSARRILQIVELAFLLLVQRGGRTGSARRAVGRYQRLNQQLQICCAARWADGQRAAAGILPQHVGGERLCSEVGGRAARGNSSLAPRPSPLFSSLRNFRSDGSKTPCISRCFLQ